MDDADATYPLTIDPWLQACVLTTRPGADEDFLGWSVAVSGDGDTVVVGVHLLDLLGTNQGAVYVYTRPGAWATTPLHTARLSADDGMSGDKLGWSVAVSNDGGTVVAGAPGRSAGGSERGTAYVFVRPSEGWQDATQVAKLIAGDGMDGDELGTAVAVSGDGSTIVAGAPHPTSTVGGGAPDRTAGGAGGTAYVFARPASGWADASHAAKLTVADGAAGDELGLSVAVSGDGGVVVAGAPFHDALGNPMGAAFVYARPGSGWTDATETARLMSSDGTSDDRLGQSVAVSGDGQVVVAGAPFHEAQTAGDERGAAFVYTRPGDGWATTMEYTAKLTASDGDYGDYLGWAVAANGNGNTIVAGAPYRDSQSEVHTGAAYVFARGPTGWYDSEQTAIVHATDGGGWDRLGISVALSADGGTVVAGAPWNSVVPGGSEWGAAYVFTKPGSQWADRTETAKLTADNAPVTDHLGFSVAMSEDGRTVVVGAPYGTGSAGHASQGAAYVYVRPTDGWPTAPVFSAKLTAVGGPNDDNLGMAVAVSSDGSTAVVGAPGYSVSGAVYIYIRPPGGWASSEAQNAKLTSNVTKPGDMLGYSVAISRDGSTIVAREIARDAAYVYVQPAGGWVDAYQTAVLTASDGWDADKGRSVDVSEDGSTIVGGSPGSDGGAGAAYVFARPSNGWVNTTEMAKLTASILEPGRLGESVAIADDGGTIAAGAPHNGPGGSYRGLVAVYVRPASGWVTTEAPSALLSVTGGTDHDYFGKSVDVSRDGSTVLGGAPHTDSIGLGAAYVYTRPSDGWVDASQSAKLTAGDALDHVKLGTSAALSGDGSAAVTGAPGTAIPPPWIRGKVYVFVSVTAPASTSGTPPSPASAGNPYDHTFSASGAPHRLLA